MAQTNTNTRITGTLPPVSRRTRALRAARASRTMVFTIFTVSFAVFTAAFRVFWAAVLVVFAAAADFCAAAFAAAFCALVAFATALAERASLILPAGCFTGRVCPFTLGFAPRSVIEAGRSRVGGSQTAQAPPASDVTGRPCTADAGPEEPLMEDRLAWPRAAGAWVCPGDPCRGPWGEVSPVWGAVRAAAWALAARRCCTYFLSPHLLKR